MSKRWVLLTVLIAFLAMFSTFVGVVQSQSEALPPLTEPGPYGVRVTRMTFGDESRENWKLETWLWYPADRIAGYARYGGKPTGSRCSTGSEAARLTR